MEFKKIARCALPIIAIGILLVIIYIILQTIPNFLSASKGTVKLVVTIYSYAMIPLLGLLYFWAGRRAVRKFNLDELGGGLSAAFAAIVIGFVQLVLEAILSFLIVGRIILATDFRPASSILASMFLGDVVGSSGIGLSALCGLGVIFFSAVVCFIIGVIGAAVSRH
ncbi:hypothetical protein HY988_04320 [Candidatus Micrarchaeota archaeon]|nr:hypothetical protein [Candidatus Micrarchaeota archaeon]